MIPQYKWYICNILCGIKSSQKDNFVGSFNTKVERSLDCISLHFKNETQPYYYQEDEEQIYEISETESENYESDYEIDYPERDEDENWGSIYKRRCLSWEQRLYQLCV